jgi:hypothetical protein
MPLHGVFKAAINGVALHGEGGFVYVKGEECAYIFPSELKGHKEACDTLQNMLANRNALRVFYALEERDNALHILAYPRERVLSDIIGDTPSTPPVSPQLAIEDVECHQDGQLHLDPHTAVGESTETAAPPKRNH